MQGPSAVKVSLPLTKILATLGPSTDDPEQLTKLIQTGVTNFRLNFSHGEFEDHAKRLKLVRSCAVELGTPVSVLGDLQGPKIRVGDIPDPGFDLPAGEKVIISVHPRATPIDRAGADEASIITCNYEKLPVEVEPGHRVLINDGNIRMLCVDRDEHSITCTVTYGGRVTSRKGVNLPDSDLSVSALTERDIEFVHWAIEHELDFLALSFVRHASDVKQLRDIVVHHCTRDSCGVGFEGPDSEPVIPIISKIETPQAVKNIDEIIEVTNGLMIARGDLGVEMDVAAVPVAQKKLVEVAHDHGKPCIVATQMLESMIERATPTRAEVSDVANAILDHADCVMLSGETAVGKFPVLAADTMRRVALVTEQSIREQDSEARPPARPQQTGNLTWALAHGAWHIAKDINAKIVVVWSQTGGTARSLSRNGFDVPVIAFSSEKRAIQRMNLLYSVIPVYLTDPPEHRSQFAELVDRLTLENGWANRGDPALLMAGKPLGVGGKTNTLAIRYIGELTPNDD
jgi:pyruvate kinase